MRFRFFLCASADFGVRRTNVSNSFCNSGYIEILRIAQAAAERRPLDCGRNAPNKRSEVKLQRKLYQPRVTNLCDLSELGPIRSISVRVEKLCVVEQVEELSPEIQVLVFRYCECLQDCEVSIAEVRPAANRALGSTKRTEQPRIVTSKHRSLRTQIIDISQSIECRSGGILSKAVGIEEIVAAGLRFQFVERCDLRR